MSDTNQASGMNARLIVLATWVVTGVLAAVAITLIVSHRLDGKSSARDSSGSHSGQVGNSALVDGAIPLSEVATGNGPTTAIAVDLVSRAFSFTPSNFDAQVAAAKKLMTGAMALRYDGLIASERVKQQVQVGLTVTTKLLHQQNNPKLPAFVGVSSLTPTTGQFLMVMQRLVTTPGSKQAQANTFMLSVSMQKIGGTWVLSGIN